MDIVGKGQVPDARVSSEIAYDLVKLATKDSEYGYKAFWINGHAEAVRFNEDYRIKALVVARERVRLEAPNLWRTGVAQGSVVGELRKVDDLESNNLFVVVPPVGPERIVCTFPDSLRDQMGNYLFKVVRVTGNLHYSEESPFPVRVEASELAQVPPRRKPMRDLRGVFAKQERVVTDWGNLLHG